MAAVAPVNNMARVRQAIEDLRDKIVDYLQSPVGGRHSAEDAQKLSGRILVPVLFGGKPGSGKTKTLNNLRMYLQDKAHLHLQGHMADRAHGTVHTSSYLYPAKRPSLLSPTTPQLILGVTDPQGWKKADKAPTIAQTLLDTDFDTHNHQHNLLNVAVLPNSKHHIFALVVGPTTAADEDFTLLSDVAKKIGNRHRIICIVTHADQLGDEEPARVARIARALRLETDSIVTVTNITSGDQAVTAEWERGMARVVELLVREQEALLEGIMAAHREKWTSRIIVKMKHALGSIDWSHAKSMIPAGWLWFLAVFWVIVMTLKVFCA
ncbi:hypothetical protein HDV00_003404 [Rhizophlyctis rosea]|nr:hypothetical protein HDV00_003404 [Rhizophlyctis rosea]